jgi:hypothetical protein
LDERGGEVFLGWISMRPDYPHKRFKDERTVYVLLIIALATDCPVAHGG